MTAVEIKAKADQVLAEQRQVMLKALLHFKRVDRDVMFANGVLITEAERITRRAIAAKPTTGRGVRVMSNPVIAFLEHFHWMVDPSVDPIRTRIREFFIDYLHSKGREGGTTEEGQVAFDAAVARDPENWPVPADRLRALWLQTTQVLNKLPSLTRPAQLVWLGFEAGHEGEIIDAALHHEFPLFTPADIAKAYRETSTHMQREAVAAAMESAIFAAWADLEKAKGRPEEELLWGKCVDALGIVEQRDGQYLNFQKLKDIADPELRQAVIGAAWRAQEEARQGKIGRRRPLE